MLPLCPHLSLESTLSYVAVSQIAAELPEIITCTQIRALCHGAGIVLQHDTLTAEGVLSLLRYTRMLVK